MLAGRRHRRTLPGRPGSRAPRGSATLCQQSSPRVAQRYRDASEWSTRKPGTLEGRAQHGPAGEVPLALLVDVGRRRPGRPTSRPAGGRAAGGRGSCERRGARRPARGSPATKGAAVTRQVAALASASGPPGRPSDEPPQTSGWSTETGRAVPAGARCSTRRRPVPCRVRGTSRRPCAGGRRGAPGRSGWRASSARAASASRGRSRSASRRPACGAGEHGADLVRRVGELRVDDQVAGADAQVGGRLAISSFEPMVGRTESSPRPVTPRRRSIQSSAACRVSTRPIVSG